MWAPPCKSPDIDHLLVDACISYPPWSGRSTIFVFRESPLEVDEHGVVEAELGEAVRAEGEEDLLRPHHRAVRHLGGR